MNRMIQNVEQIIYVIHLFWRASMAFRKYIQMLAYIEVAHHHPESDSAHVKLNLGLWWSQVILILPSFTMHKTQLNVTPLLTINKTDKIRNPAIMANFAMKDAKKSFVLSEYVEKQGDTCMSHKLKGTVAFIGRGPDFSWVAISRSTKMSKTHISLSDQFQSFLTAIFLA